MNPTKKGATSRCFGSHPPTDDRRKEIRYPCHDPAEVRLLHNDAPGFAASVLDISKSGLRLACPIQLDEGSRLEVILQRQAIVFGEVRYCQKVGQEFHSGVQIERVFYTMNVSSDHLDDEQIIKYIAGEGLIAKDVLALTQHIRSCADCRSRMDAMALSERVGRGKLTKR